jgi:hypothetical protein
MRVPVLLVGNPAASFWLTDEQPGSQAGQPVLVDATGRVYRPAEVLEPILLRQGTCSQVFYAAAYNAGYQVVWLDEEISS